MIKKEKFKELIEKGIDIGQYTLLVYLGLNLELKDLFSNLKIRGYREALLKKGYLSFINDTYELTDKGKDIVGMEQEEDEAPIALTLGQLDLFCEQICQTIEEMSLEVTQKKKIKNKSGKIYNSSPKELKQRLEGFFKKFGTHNLEDIRKGIIIYTKEILEHKIPYALTLDYFIWKQKVDGTISSELLQYLDMEETEEIKKVEDTRKLF